MAGVEVASASEALSAEDGRTTGTSVEEAGEERSALLSARASLVTLCSGVSVGNCCKSFGDNLKVTTSDKRAFLEVLTRLARPLDGAAGMMDEGLEDDGGNPRPLR